MKRLRTNSLKMSAAFFAGMFVATEQAHASGTNFSTIANNITTSISSLPGLLTGLAYMFGILLGVLGVLKIKDHVENPTQTPLKDGAIRLAAGGGLFALPIVFEAMQETIGNEQSLKAAQLKKVSFALS